MTIYRGDFMTLKEILWKIYHRPQPTGWQAVSEIWGKGNLPWDDLVFSERMLREHLDESHGAASRKTAERAMQIEWLWEYLGLARGDSLLDVTCGPGLYAIEFAKRGCFVTGVDFSPAAIKYACDLAIAAKLTSSCKFVQADVRQMDYSGADFSAAIFLYGQITVFKVEETKMLLKKIAQSLKAGGKLCIEILDELRIDKKDSTWWFTDDKGLWGDSPFLHLGERFWLEDEQVSVERFQIIDLESGELKEVHLCDQAYSVDTMTMLLKEAGFSKVSAYKNWGGLPLYDAKEWVVYVAEVGG